MIAQLVRFHENKTTCVWWNLLEWGVVVCIWNPSMGSCENRQSHEIHCLASLAYLACFIQKKYLSQKTRWTAPDEGNLKFSGLHVGYTVWVILCLKRLQDRASEKEYLRDLVCNDQNGADEAWWLFLLVALYYFRFCLSVLVLAALKLLSSLFYPLFVRLAIFFFHLN